MFWQEAFQYRSESFIWFLFDVVSPLVMILMWRSSYGDAAEIGGYTLAQMMLYYVGMMALRTVLNVHPEWAISEEIRTGGFSKHLLRPLTFSRFHLIGETAWKLLRLLFLTPVVAGFLLWLGPEVTASVGLTRELIPAFLGSLLFGFFLNYTLKVSLGLMAFWMTESIGAFNIFFLFQYLFEGTLMPLNLLPPAVQRMGDWLPFRYFYSLTMSIFQGKVGTVEAYQGLAVQVAWCAGAYLLMKIVYAFGVRRYSAVGG